MAKKKSAKNRATKKKAAKKTAVKRKVAKKKSSGRKQAAAAKRTQKSATKAGKQKTAAKRKVVKKKAIKPSRKKKSARKIKSKSLGRPRIAGEAKLDQFFQKDYQAREIFDFLGVQTLRELETYAADEILEKLTGPMVQTVQRIRKTLAMVNRSLANDRDFALDFKNQL